MRFENQTDHQLISHTTSYTAFCTAECNLHVLAFINAWHYKVCTFVILNISKVGVMLWLLTVHFHKYADSTKFINTLIEQITI